MQLNELLNKSFLKIILSNKKDKSFAYNKSVIVPIRLKGKLAWQMTLYTNTQAFQENLKTLLELQNRLQEFFGNKYKQLNFLGTDEDIEMKVTKKGKVLTSVHKHTHISLQNESHNRIKKRLLFEDEKIPP